MKSSEYLYGSNFDAVTLRELNYISALRRKIIWSMELVDSLIDVHHSNRDMRRINDSLNAQKFCNALIDECYGKDIH